MTEVAVSVRGLTKSYGDFRAVGGIDFEIARGEVFALLGPNGAGKTTTVEILEGFRKRDGGEVSVLGQDPGNEGRALKSRIGIVLQSTGVDPYLSVAETIAMYGGYFPHPRPVDEVIELVGLGDKASERVSRLSGGLQRRLDVGVALVGDPDLLFLDEPTTGFDPTARRGAWELVKNLASLGKTVLLTTHYMDEAQFLADRVAVIAAGKIVAEGSPQSLGGRDLARPRVRYRLVGEAVPPIRLAGERLPDGHNEIPADDLVEVLHELTGWALDNRVELEALSILRPSLEDVYLSLTGEVHDPRPTEQAKAGRHRRSPR